MTAIGAVTGAAPDERRTGEVSIWARDTDWRGAARGAPIEPMPATLRWIETPATRGVFVRGSHREIPGADHAKIPLAVRGGG